MGTLAERWPGSAERGISPVIGVILMVAIVVVMSAVTAMMIFGAQEGGAEPAPNVVMSVESGADDITHTLYHEGGEMLVGDKVTLKGAANPDVMNGKTLTQGDTIDFLPTEEDLKLVFTGENDRGHVLRTFEPDRTVPVPDEGCGYVNSETSGGVDDITLDDVVVNCDITTQGKITLKNDAVVIGDMESTTGNVNINQGETIGSVTADGTVTIPNGDVDGSVTAKNGNVDMSKGSVSGDIVSESAGVDLADNGPVEVGGSVDAANDFGMDEGTVEGSVSAVNAVDVGTGTIGGDITSSGAGVDLGDNGPVTVTGTIEAQNDIGVNGDADIEGDMISETSKVKVVSGSVTGDIVGKGGDVDLGGVARVEVDGDVAASGTNILKSGSDVTGDAYGSVTCSSSATIDGQSCNTYKPGPSYGAYTGP
jgi:flagellin-like protein